MRYLFLLIAAPALGADIGSPVPMPTGDSAADVRAIVGYLENAAAATERREAKRDAEVAAISARLSALETRLASAERFAARAGYVPPVVNVAPAPPPAPGVAVGVPPTTATIGAPIVVTSPPPGPGPGSFAGGYRVVSTSTSAPVMVRPGGTDRGPLGFGILPKLLGGCGGADPTPEYRPASYRYTAAVG